MIRLRPYHTTDTERVLELWWESWHAIDSALVHPSTREGWRQRWLTEIVPTHEVIVALDDRDEIAGFAAADASSKTLSQIFVSSSRKRQGIGRALLLWAKQAMPEGFTLHTLTLNAASRKFYLAAGLLEGEVRVNPWNGLETVECRWVPSAPGAGA